MKDKKYYKKVAIGIVVGIISAIAIVGFIKAPSKSSDRLAEDLQKEFKAVSYTHLTLPTICSV